MAKHERSFGWPGRDPMNRRHSWVLLFAVGFAAIILASRLPAPVFAQPQDTAISQLETAFDAVHAAEQAGANVTGLDAMLNQASGLITEGTAIQSSQPAEAQHLFTEAGGIAAQVTSEANTAVTAGQGATFRGELFLAGELGVIALGCVLVYLYLPRVFWRIWAGVNGDSRVSPA